MKYFTNCSTLDELKKEYRRLAQLFHPDCGGDTATMQRINADYTVMMEKLKADHNASADEAHKVTEAPEEFIAIITALLKLKGLEVELCGSWLWIGGNTRENKEALKAAGCRWSKNKKLWYWHHAEDGARWSRGKQTMGEIRRKYGSQVFRGGAESTNFTKIGAAV